MKREKRKDVFLCTMCGKELIWDSADMAYDVCDDYKDDDTALVNYFHCPNCGCSYEVIDPNEEERKTDYKEYWYGQGTIQTPTRQL